MGIETAIINTTKEVTLNVTNHIANHLPNDTINVSVQTGDHWGWLTAIGTIILAIGTIVLAIIAFVQFRRADKRTLQSNENTQKSNELYRLELIARLRPEFFFDSAKFYSEPSDIRFMIFSCLIKNMGTVPMRNITIHYDIDRLKITPDTIIAKGNTVKEKIHPIAGTLEPRRFHEFKEKFLKAEVAWQQIWIALWINYEFLDDIKEEVLAVFYFDWEGKTGFEWYSHRDMKEARDRLQKSSL